MISIGQNEAASHSEVPGRSGRHLGDLDVSFPGTPDGVFFRNPDGTSRRRGRLFPPTTLEDALVIPKLFLKVHSTEALSFVQVTKLSGIEDDGWRNLLLQSATQFGLVRDVDSHFALTSLGERCISAGDPNRTSTALAFAFLSVQLYRRMARLYGESEMPSDVRMTEDLTEVADLEFRVSSQCAFNYRADNLFIGPGVFTVTDERVSKERDALSKSTRDYPQWIFADSGPAAEELRKSVAHPPAGSKKSLREVSPPDPTSPTGHRPARPIEVTHPRCFIAMPFTEHNNQYKAGFFKEVLETLLEPAIKAAGLEPFTARREGSDLIHATIVNDLLDADLVLVDLTEHNPNVLFELGLRMHADLPVVLIRAKGTGSIFDVDSLLRVLEYDPNLWHSTIKTDVENLTKHVRAAWSARKSRRTYMQILRTYGRESD